MMANVSIIAGSKSDEKFVEPMQRIFTNNNIQFEVQYLSAHRDKKALETYVIQSDADYFIAVAGLAAALPGSIAADTNKPVIAVPVWSGSASSPAGLDALFAAVQMPPPKDGKDVAVGCVAINHPEYAAEFVANYNKAKYTGYKDICVVCLDKELEPTALQLNTGLSEFGITSVTKQVDEVRKYDSNIYMIISNNYKKRDVTLRLLPQDTPVICIPVMSCMDHKTFELLQKREEDVSESNVYELTKGMFNFAPNYPAVSVGYGSIKNAAYLAKRLLRK